MTNSTSTDATSGGAWCNRITTKQLGYYSTTPAEKHKLIKIHPITLELHGIEAKV